MVVKIALKVGPDKTIIPANKPKIPTNIPQPQPLCVSRPFIDFIIVAIPSTIQILP